MAIPAFRAAGAIAHAIIAVTPGAPAGLATDDIEILQIESPEPNGTATLDTANGFTLITSVGAANASSTIDTRGTWYWRRYAGQGDPVVTDMGNHVVAQRYAFSGCITSGNPWDIWVPSSELVEDTSGSATGGTTTVDECLIAACLISGKPDTLSTTEMSAPTNADLGSVTEQADNAGNSGTGGWLGLITGTKATAGTFTATTYTHATATYKCHMVIALKPPAAVTDRARLGAVGRIAPMWAGRA